MSESLSIVRWELHNFKSFTNLVLEPKTITTLTGANGLGKSNVLESFKALFEGGFSEHWIRQGETEAHILADLSDGTKIKLELKLPTEKRKRYQRNVEVTAPTGESIKAPQEFLNALASGISYNPAHFLVCDEKERAKYLTSFLRVELSESELREAVKQDWYREFMDPRLAPFDQIKVIRDTAYTRRTTVNGEHKRIYGAVQTLRQCVPSLNVDSVALDSAATAAAKELREAESGYKSALTQMTSEATAAEQASSTQRETARKEANNAYQKRLAEIEGQYSTEIAAIGVAKVESRQLITDEWTPQMDAARNTDAQARGKLQEYHQAIGAREALSREEDRLRELAGEEAHLSATIERLDELKRRKMDSSPIPGLELRDGKIFYEGRSFDEATNTAKRVEVAIQLAALNPGRWPGMLIDDAEHLDKETWEAFLEAAKGSGYQIIAARVTDGELAVQTS